MVKTSSLHRIRRLVGLPEIMGGDTLPHYNLCPGSPIVAVHHRLGDRALELPTWGLVPFWAKEKMRGYHNATAERVATSPAFRKAFKQQRCLIFADGFYEWDKAKQPHYFYRDDGEPIAIAGIYDVGLGILGAAVITTTANRVVGNIHDRMPVVLEASEWDAWLDPKADGQAMLRPAADAVLACHRVSRRVNNPSENAPELLTPVPDCFSGN